MTVQELIDKLEQIPLKDRNKLVCIDVEDKMKQLSDCLIGNFSINERKSIILVSEKINW